MIQRILQTTLLILFSMTHLHAKTGIEAADEIASTSASVANQPGAVAFTPPEGWRVADPTALPKSVQVMVVGKSSHAFPPSINLGTDSFPGSLKEYLKVVKSINDADGAEWRDLGTIQTDAGKASLSQVDMRTEWGDVRMMHVIFLKNGIAYILTASALKEDFSKFYNEFFKSMRSLRITPE